ncbi:MAG: hypothetical protein K5697_00765 [Lachnospiraceae bacterium]|nr:hypothetical protein [Lachnospiraceae bacterium]
MKKKAVMAVLVTVLALSLAGCEKDPGTADPATEQGSENEGGENGEAGEEAATPTPTKVPVNYEERAEVDSDMLTRTIADYIGTYRDEEGKEVSISGENGVYKFNLNLFDLNADVDYDISKDKVGSFTVNKMMVTDGHIRLEILSDDWDAGKSVILNLADERVTVTVKGGEEEQKAEFTTFENRQ